MKTKRTEPRWYVVVDGKVRKYEWLIHKLQTWIKNNLTLDEIERCEIKYTMVEVE